MHPEAPDRGVQIELVYQKINEPTRALLRAAIPSDRMLTYRVNAEDGRGLSQKISSLPLGGGEPYLSILAIAAGARNSTQVANAFGILALIEQHAAIHPDDPANYAKRLEISRNHFLQNIAQQAILLTSDEARAMQAEMIGIWNQYKQNPKAVLNTITANFEVGNPYPRPKSTAEPYWAEAYFLTILDPATPLELRKLLLSNSGRFNHGDNSRYSIQSNNAVFTDNNSFMKNVDASWVYPDIFGQNGSKDVKDWEIAGLRKNLADLQAQMQKRPSTSPEHTQLLGTIRQLEQVAKQTEEKLTVYKAIGQHPLDALHIGYGVWQTTSPEQRAKLIKEAYRRLAKKYHYQVPHQDPRYDPLTEELANKEFTRLTLAQDYLNKHLPENEF